MTERWGSEWEAVCRAGLERHVARVVAAFTGREAPSEVDDPAPMIDRIVTAFSLSIFERDVLVLAAAVELDPRIVDAEGPDGGGGSISLDDARWHLDAAQWSALSPSAPLRRWRLVHVDENDPLHGRMRIDERVLFALLGVLTVDATLQRLAQPLDVGDPADALPSITAAAENAARQWAGAGPGRGRIPLLHVVGPDLGAARRVVALSAAYLGLKAWELDAASLPSTPEELDALAVVVEREVVLGDVVLAIMDCDAEPTARRALQHLVDRTSVPLALLGQQARRDWRRATSPVELERTPRDEIVALWRAGLGSAADGLDEALGRLAHDFTLPIGRVHDIASSARSTAGRGDTVAASAWRSARGASRGALDGLAQRVTTRATWNDLVLPQQQLRTLREIAAHVRQRSTVEHTWGFAAQGDNLAVTALFHGPSGVGKTLAARVIAAELELDLYRIDLSQTVSKYIGETEKNLKALFDAAEESSAVLVFDEADALFGKRSDVRDAHDRYANIEISYLLQRMESYRGLAILTTNLPAHLDGAFLRRIRYSIAFPLPDRSARGRMWRRAFPRAAPTDRLEIDALAQLSVSGASIANIALGAAVLAADAGRSIGMPHVLRAAQAEYAKLDRTIAAVEVEGWPDTLLEVESDRELVAAGSDGHATVSLG